MRYLKIYKRENYVSKVKRLKINNTRERYLNTQEIQKLIDEVREMTISYIFFAYYPCHVGEELRLPSTLEKEI